MHKMWAQNAPNASAKHKLFIMLVHCKRGHCVWIQCSYTTSLVPLWSGLVLTISFLLYKEQSSTFSEMWCSLPPTRPLFSPPSGSSLFSSGRTCPWPLPSSENSVARLLSPTHSFSALLEVRCKPGFMLPNGLDATIRRCQGDRQWSGDEPICTGGFEFDRKKKPNNFFLTPPQVPS